MNTRLLGELAARNNETPSTTMQEKIPNQKNVRGNRRGKPQSSSKNTGREAKPSKSLTSRQIPPIHVKDTNCNLKQIEIILKAENITLNKDYCFRSYQNGDFGVHTNNGEMHNRIFASLREKDVKCFTRSPRKERDVYLILKGINPCFDENEVLQALTEQKFVNVEVVKVSKFLTKKNSDLKKGPSSFLVQLKNGSETSRITNQDLLLGQIVKWEFPDRSQPVQCKKCQRVRHVARLCNLGYRCVKCPNQHKPGECQFKKNTLNSEETDEPKLSYCINCNEYGHPASFRGCQVLLNIQNEVDFNKKDINEKRMESVQFRLEENHFPDLSRNHPKTPVANTWPIRTHNRAWENSQNIPPPQGAGLPGSNESLNANFMKNWLEDVKKEMLESLKPQFRGS